MLSNEELIELVDLIAQRKLLALAAQRRLQRFLDDCREQLEKYLGSVVLVRGRPDKRPSRIIRKVEKCLEAGRSSLSECLDVSATDLVAGRVIVLYLEDIRRAHSFFSDFTARRRSITLLGPEEDYVAVPKSTGYRGLHQSVTVRERGQSITGEVQFVTFMQLDWAEKEHLVYEHPGKFPDEILRELRNRSDQLHAFSLRSDELRRLIADTLRR